MKRLKMLTVFLCSLFMVASGQDALRQTILTLKHAIRFREVDSFYALHNYQPAWNQNNQQHLITLLASSAGLGLDEKDYQFAFIRQLAASKLHAGPASDSFTTDILLTDAAIHFFTELKNGKGPPSLGYNGLNYLPSAAIIVDRLKEALQTGQLDSLAAGLQPQTKEYKALLAKLRWLNHIIADGQFAEEKVSGTSLSGNNKALLKRLYQLGLTDTLQYLLSKTEVKAQLRAAQKLFDVLPDGIVRPTILKALNVPIRYRIKELEAGLNLLRWLSDLKKDEAVALVNIPSATLLLYQKDSVILDSKLIVGKKTTATPSLSSTISEVIIYPYWTVPHRIATRELLPSIKRNIGFLDDGNFQVLNKQGQQLDPYNINWQALSVSYFPYTLRQSTGCDNSLGLVKFNFYNPFTVYLHDTPSKSLFTLNKRFFSHGCMRVEKPVELAHFLLGANSGVLDSLLEKGCVDQQAPITIALEKPLPVMVLYSTVWYTKEGSLRFYDDIYNRNSFKY